MKVMKGTTPTFTLTLPEDIDLNAADNVYVTLSYMNSGREIFTKESEDLVIDGNVIDVFLTQEETLSFPSAAMLQVNWTYNDAGVNKRASSEIVSIDFTNNLLSRVVE